MTDRIHNYEKHELLRLVTSDGFVVTALLVTNKEDAREDALRAPILLQIHGLLGHFLAHGTPRLLPHALSARGFDSLSINTRLASIGQMTGQGIFTDTINDIDAAVEFLETEGFSNIFVLGYSLGASMVINWAASRQNERIKGIILEGCVFSGPKSQKMRFSRWGSDPSYEAIYAQAREVLGEKPHKSLNDETFVAYQCRGPDRKPGSSEIYTYKTWWFMGGPEARNAMAFEHIAKVKYPLLLIRGEADFLTEEWEPEALAKIAREAGNSEVRVKQIPNARHDCMENPKAMIEEITRMFLEYSVDPYIRQNPA